MLSWPQYGLLLPLSIAVTTRDGKLDTSAYGQEPVEVVARALPAGHNAYLYWCEGGWA